MSKTTEFVKKYMDLPVLLQAAVNLFDKFLVEMVPSEELHLYANQQNTKAHERIRPLLAEIAQAELDERARYGR